MLQSTSDVRLHWSGMNDGIKSSQVLAHGLQEGLHVVMSDVSHDAFVCCASGPSESLLQIMWWRVEFLSVNWVVSLFHWSHLPGKLSRCCIEMGEKRSMVMFSSWPLFFFSHHLRLSLSVWGHMRWKQHWTEWLTGVNQELRGQRPAWRSSPLFSGWRIEGQPSLSVASTPR